MLRNYFKIALRNLWHNRIFSFINITGLATGLAVTLLIALYVAHEYSFDRFHEHADRIVKVELKHQEGDQIYTIPWMSYRFAEAVQKASPEVENYARINISNDATKQIMSDVQHKNYESGFGFADNRFFQVFSFPLIKGDRRTVLSRPETVVLTESMAKKYFGNSDPIGKTITYDKKHLFEVVGIVADPPLNSTIRFNFLANFQTQRALDRALYRNHMDEKQVNELLESVGAGGGVDTYFLLKNADAAANVARKIPSVLSEKAKNKYEKFYLYALPNYHFDTSYKTVQKTVNTFGIIAVLILSLALINYVSLTTARATIRAKEVSVRKVVGAARKSLIVQFYLESTLYVTLAFGLALVFFSLLKPFFYDTLQLKIDSSFVSTPYFWLPAIGFYVVSILLSGSYPALLLSNFTPIAILKGKLGIGKGSATVRRSMTVFQFTISIALIIGSILIKKQLDLFLRQNVGLERERVVGIRLDPETGIDKHYSSLRNNLSQISGVEAVTASTLPIYGGYMNGWNLKTLHSDKVVSANSFPVDEEFIKTMRVQWAIAPAQKADLSSGGNIIINEAAAKELGINAKNYQQRIDIGSGTPKNLVGVVKDFPFTSLHRQIRPMAFFIGKNDLFHNYIYVKLEKTANAQEKLAVIKHVYDSYKADRPFDYYFLDEAYQKLYEYEISTGKIIFAFTGFAILIACLGLFGLATFTAEQRTKEIGIRKVLGASIVSIVRLLSGEFLKLVFIGIVIASPIAYYFMDNWLQGFAHRVDITWWYFAIAALAGITIAFLTVSAQSIKAALMNPTESLKTE
ncbi:ABC transporter permease [Runella sp.]|uniref:ABC transporter permease n=1 Tax=Runella sp. TaxID=1960881 RepID=UPI003D105B70